MPTRSRTSNSRRRRHGRDAAAKRARDAAYARHASSLADGVDDAAFAAAFGAPKAELAALLSSKTVTLPLLLSLSPPGTPDPSPLLYNDVFYGLAGASTLALACNVAAFKMRPKER